MRNKWEHSFEMEVSMESMFMVLLIATYTLFLLGEWSSVVFSGGSYQQSPCAYKMTWIPS